jgi:ferritin-like metal-binding protein YciE
MSDLIVHRLQGMYYAEKQLVKAVPKQMAKITDPQQAGLFGAVCANAAATTVARFCRRRSTR